MYENGDHGHAAIPEGRPLSFIPATRDEILMGRPEADHRTFAQRAPLTRTQSDRIYGAPQHLPIQHNFMVGRSNSAQHGGTHGPLPTPPRSPAETAASSFPLNDIDYESSPAAVAQELSNLQAIRRMSMDVNLADDPDLPSFGMTPMAAVDSDEEDASSLFWVPARLHPELAPKEFKTFIDTRVESIRRRSGDFPLSPDSPMRPSSEGGLMRKKSMLSRQIDTNAKNADQYQDGAERLDRKRSLGEAGKRTSSGIQNLQELEQLMQDPSKIIQRLSMEGHLLGEQLNSEDMPILPITPGGNSLRRSTRTTYRRGSLKKGERIPPSRRAHRSNAEPEGDEVSPKTRSAPFSNDLSPSIGLTRGQTDSSRSDPARITESPAPVRPAGNFSRPGRRGVPLTVPVSSIQSNQAQLPQAQRLDDHFTSSRKLPSPRDHHDNQDILQRQLSVPSPESTLPSSREPKHFVSQISSNGRTTARLDIPNTTDLQMEEKTASPKSYHSDRDSSYNQQQPRPVSGQQSSHVVNRPKQRTGMGPQPVIEQQTLQHMAAHPSPLPGNSTRTDSLSFIPTLTEDKRSEPKKDTKKSSWSWGSLLGSEEKEKERRKEEELREANNKKLRQKLDKPVRLDLLQQTVDNGARGRESLVLDRGDMKLEEERKKESNRKANETKKEKESGLFSSLFGGKKKHDRDPAGHKNLRPPTPSSPLPILVPDRDYKWTRFSILEERAIYRMAHIKLANPRRALYSQVLLSNFMYSYLAKVQQMHPQIQIPQSAAQKAAQRAAQQQAQQQQQKQQQVQQQAQHVQSHQIQPAQTRRKDQPEEYYQYQRYQEVKPS